MPTTIIKTRTGTRILRTRNIILQKDWAATKSMPKPESLKLAKKAKARNRPIITPDGRYNEVAAANTSDCRCKHSETAARSGDHQSL